MTLSLSPEIQKRIDERVRSGRYATAEDVVAAAMASLDQQERLVSLEPAELEALYPGLKAKLEEGIAAARAGHLSDGETFFDELEREESGPGAAR